MTQDIRDGIANYNTPELQDSLELTFLEDQATFEGASKDQLRAHFQKWAPGAFASENPRASVKFDGDMPIVRYRYFVQVDEAALCSTIVHKASGPQVDLMEGYVNFVDGYWQTLSELGLDDEEEDPWSDGLPDDDELIEGCTEENVGWMKLSPATVSMCFYHALGGWEYESWYIFYRRPPAIVEW